MDFGVGLVTLSAPVIMDEERFEAATRNSVENKEEQRDGINLLRPLIPSKFGQVASGWETEK